MSAVAAAMENCFMGLPFPLVDWLAKNLIVKFRDFHTDMQTKRVFRGIRVRERHDRFLKILLAPEFAVPYIS